MKLSHTLGMTALAAMLAASGFASAAGTHYRADGYIVSSTCGALSASLAAGVESLGDLYLQKAGVAGSAVESAGTAPTATGAGSTVTFSCINNAGAPAAPRGSTNQLDGKTMVFVCYTDHQTGPGAATYVLSQAFTAKATHSANAYTVESVNTLLNGITPVCSWTTDGSYIVQ
jgi:hypothetical protein